MEDNQINEKFEKMHKRLDAFREELITLKRDFEEHKNSMIYHGK